MNKKKLLSLVLSFALVFTTVFAGAGSVFADETTVYSPLNHNTVDWEDADEVNAAVEDNAVTFTTPTQDVKISKKGYYLHEFTVAGSATGYATVSLIDPSGNEVASERLYLEWYDSYGTSLGYTSFETNLEKTGYYQVALSYEFEGVAAATYFAHYLPQSTKESPASILGKGEMMYDNPNGGYSWFKVKTSGTRNIKIQFSEGGTYSVRLYKSNKSSTLGGGTVKVGSAKDYTTYYAVPKGTYYVRVYKASSTPYFTVKMSYSKVSEKSGSSKAKAVTLSKSKTKKGTILATQSASSSADWYKVKITKDQKFYMHLNFKTGGAKGGVKISVYKKGSSKVQLSKKFSAGESSYDWKIYSTGNGGKLEAGTYYFKVQKYDYGTGYYSLKWNNKSK